MDESPYILVADDDEFDLKRTVTALKHCGFMGTVIPARDGVEALDFLYGRGQYNEYGSRKHVLLLLDLKMPRVDGWEVLRCIRTDEAMGAVTVVIWTSSTRESDMDGCYQLGANAYVVKPSTMEAIKVAVQGIQNLWMSHNMAMPLNRK